MLKNIIEFKNISKMVKEYFNNKTNKIERATKLIM